MLHSSLESVHQARKALKQVFSQETSGDSQYALFALGWKLHPVIDSTRDPDAILKAIDSKRFGKRFRTAMRRTFRTTQSSSFNWWAAGAGHARAKLRRRI